MDIANIIYDTVLPLFKMDLGITSTVKDDYFVKLIESAVSELDKKFSVDIGSIEDIMLISDYAAWRYRKRQSDEPISKNLNMRIRNRIARRRAQDGPIL